MGGRLVCRLEPRRSDARASRLRETRSSDPPARRGYRHREWSSWTSTCMPGAARRIRPTYSAKAAFERDRRGQEQRVRCGSVERPPTYEPVASISSGRSTSPHHRVGRRRRHSVQEDLLAEAGELLRPLHCSSHRLHHDHVGDLGNGGLRSLRTQVRAAEGECRQDDS